MRRRARRGRFPLRCCAGGPLALSGEEGGLLAGGWPLALWVPKQVEWVGGFPARPVGVASWLRLPRPGRGETLQEKLLSNTDYTSGLPELNGGNEHDRELYTIIHILSRGEKNEIIESDKQHPD